MTMDISRARPMKPKLASTATRLCGRDRSFRRCRTTAAQTADSRIEPNSARATATAGRTACKRSAGSRDPLPARSKLTGGIQRP